jgi:hypothetical protein
MLRHRGLNERQQLFGAGILNPIELARRTVAATAAELLANLHCGNAGLFSLIDEALDGHDGPLCSGRL